MKRNLNLYRDQSENPHRHEIGWSSQQNCIIPLSQDGAWYAGPLHANQGQPVPGNARRLRYALDAGRSGSAWLESLSVLVFSETGALLAQLALPGGPVQDRPRELDIQSLHLHLPLQCKLRLLLKTPRREGAAMHRADRHIDTWLALAA